MTSSALLRRARKTLLPSRPGHKVEDEQASETKTRPRHITRVQHHRNNLLMALKLHKNLRPLRKPSSLQIHGLSSFEIYLGQLQRPKRPAKLRTPHHLGVLKSSPERALRCGALHRPQVLQVKRMRPKTQSMDTHLMFLRLRQRLTLESRRWTSMTTCLLLNIRHLFRARFHLADQAVETFPTQLLIPCQNHQPRNPDLLPQPRKPPLSHHYVRLFSTLATSATPPHSPAPPTEASRTSETSIQPFHSTPKPNNKPPHNATFSLAISTSPTHPNGPGLPNPSQSQDPPPFYPAKNGSGMHLPWEHTCTNGTPLTAACSYISTCVKKQTKQASRLAGSAPSATPFV